MASYMAKRSKHATLVAKTADTVTLSSRPTSIELRNFSTTAVIFYRVEARCETRDPADSKLYVDSGEAA
jgi:hypothetical protein